jgi:hypothetical protein
MQVVYLLSSPYNKIKYNIIKWNPYTFWERKLNSDNTFLSKPPMSTEGNFSRSKVAGA